MKTRTKISTISLKLRDNFSRMETSPPRPYLFWVNQLDVRHVASHCGISAKLEHDIFSKCAQSSVAFRLCHSEATLSVFLLSSPAAGTAERTVTRPQDALSKHSCILSSRLLCHSTAEFREFLAFEVPFSRSAGVSGFNSLRTARQLCNPVSGNWAQFELPAWLIFIAVTPFPLTLHTLHTFSTHFSFIESHPQFTCTPTPSVKIWNQNLLFLLLLFSSAWFFFL